MCIYCNKKCGLPYVCKSCLRLGCRILYKHRCKQCILKLHNSLFYTEEDNKFISTWIPNRSFSNFLLKRIKFITHFNYRPTGLKLYTNITVQEHTNKEMIGWIWILNNLNFPLPIEIKLYIFHCCYFC